MRLGALVAAALLLAACAEFGASSRARSTPYVIREPEEGLLGPAHAAHPNELVFSLRPIPRLGGQEAALTRTAALLEPIYARLYLSASPWNLAAAKGQACTVEPGRDSLLIFQIVDVNGAQAGDLLASKPISEKLLKSGTSFSIADGADDALNDAKVVYPRDDWGDAVTNPKAVDYHFAARLVPRLREGSNQVRLRALISCGAEPIELATGTIELQVAPGDQERFWAAHGPTLKPYPTREFAKLEPGGRQVYRDLFGADPLRIFPVSDWEYAQNLSGVVTRRQISVAVVEQKNGACQIIQIDLEQGAAGAKSFGGEVRFTGEAAGGPQPFPCVAAR